MGAAGSSQRGTAFMHSSSTAAHQLSREAVLARTERVKQRPRARLNDETSAPPRPEVTSCFTLNNSLFTAERVFTATIVHRARVFKPFN